MSMKITNIREFQGTLGKFKVEVKDQAEKMVRRTAFAVDKAVVMASPVDTGYFRANWQVTLEVPATGTVAHIPGSNGSSAASNTAKAMSQLGMVTKDYKLGQTIYIVNNVVYGPRLNDGHSKQAPRNFVGKAVQAGIAEAKR